MVSTVISIIFFIICSYSIYCLNTSVPGSYAKMLPFIGIVVSGLGLIITLIFHFVLKK